MALALPDTTTQRHKPRWLTTLRVKWPFVVSVILLLLLIGAPLFELLMTSVRLGYPGRLTGWTLEHYRQAILNPVTYSALGNTLIVASIGTAISVALAVLFAWFVERTDMPLRNLAWALLLLPMALPGILFVMAWTQLLSPKSGLINIPLRELLSWFGIVLDEGPLDIYTMTGLIFLDAMRGVTTVFLMVVGAFRLFDPSLEEAATVSGASRFATLRRVTLPALVPAIIAGTMYSFIGSMEQFESALAVGLQAGIFMLSTVIFFTVQMRVPINYGLGAVYAILFMVIMIVLVIIYRKIVSRAERYVTVTGKGYRPRRISLGGWRYAALGLVGFYSLISVILPTIVLVWASFIPPYAATTYGAQEFGLQNYRSLISDPQILAIAWRTLVMMFWTATITMLMAFLVSWSIVRSNAKGASFLDGLSFIPYAFPGVTIAIALIFVFLNPPFNSLGIYGTIWILVIGLITQYIAFGTRLMNGAVVQIQKELEEAANVSGAPSLSIMWRITLPLLMPAFIAGWIWVAAHALRAFSVPLVLSSSRNEVVAARIWAIWSDGQYNEAAALGVMMLIVLFPLTLLMRRFMANVKD